MGRIKNWDHVEGKKWHEQNMWKNRKTGDEVFINESCGLPNPCFSLEADKINLKNIQTFTLARKKAIDYMKKHI